MSGSSQLRIYVGANSGAEDQMWNFDVDFGEEPFANRVLSLLGAGQYSVDRKKILGSCISCIELHEGT